MNIAAIGETVSAMPPELTVSSARPEIRPEAAASPHLGEAKASSSSSSPKKEELKRMVEEMQKHIESMRVNLKFSTYGEHGERIAIAVTNGETGEVVREIPPEEIQELYVRMSELVGMIFNRSA